jgi:hypothetical protein
MLLKRAIGLPTVMLVVITAALAIFLSQTSTPSQTYAQSAYHPSESSVSSQPLPPVPYPSPEDVTTKPTPTPTEEVITVEVSIAVAVEGLEGNDTVELQIVPDTEKTTSSLQALGVTLPKMSLHNESGKVATTAIPVGTYKLMISAPDTYFREPQGYLFRLTETGIVNRSGTSFHFKLIPPSAQDLPPCRDTMVIPSSNNPAGDIPFEEPKIICRAERLIDVSTPPKQPEQPTESKKGVLGAGYHYAGPHTVQDNQGVWGRNYVVNASVRHSPGPEQFVVERVYANDSTYTKWMEAGWAEHWSRDDRQYVYEFDSATSTWHYFDQYSLSVGSPVETEVYYISSINKWRALYHIGGSNWAVLAEESLSFTTADNGFSRGEVYTGDDTHPILPPSGFDLGYLLIGGVWMQWDTRYSTFVDENQPYKCDMINQYYRFTIHSPVIFLPLVIKD